MSVRFLIIDGYNVMHAAGLARANYGPGDLARQRHELLVKLARRLTIDERKRCTVVFDAIDAPPNLKGRFRHEEMVVLFAEPGHEADELIELLVSQHSAAKHLTVVSSDHRIQTAIRRRRGIGIDSELFLTQLESPHRQVGRSPRSKSSASRPGADLDFWMDEFDGISTEKLLKEDLDQAVDSKSDWEQNVDQLQKRIQDPSGLDEWLNESGKPIPPSKPTGK